jgi:hypothetical protein
VDILELRRLIGREIAESEGDEEGFCRSNAKKRKKKREEGGRIG